MNGPGPRHRYVLGGPALVLAGRTGGAATVARVPHAMAELVRARVLVISALNESHAAFQRNAPQKGRKGPGEVPLDRLPPVGRGTRKFRVRFSSADLLGGVRDHDDTYPGNRSRSLLG